MLARERRSEARVPTDDPAVATILQPGSHPHLECRILNTSKKGLRIALAVALEPGVLIQIRLNEVITMAEVRYCVAAGDSFHVGARILSAMSSRQGAPGKGS